MKINFYKAIFFAVFAMVLITTSKLNAQVANYIFSQSNGTYVPLTVGFSLGDATTNDQYFVDPNSPLGGTNVLGAGLPIGFNFTYNDTVYDKFGVCANGFITLGNGSIDFSNANLTLPLSSGLRRVIAGVGRDLESQPNASIRYATLGTSPNRTLIIQWQNYTRFNNVADDSLNFQIRLSETSNAITVVYGKMLTGSTQTNLSQVGIKGATAFDVNMRTTATSWLTTTATTVNTAGCTLNTNIFPPNGLTFTWLPPLPCVAPPTAGIASVAPSATCAALKVVSVNGNSVGIGATLQWLVSADSVNWNVISGATSSSYSITQSSSNYYRCVNTCSGLTDSTNVVLVTGASSATTCYCTLNLHQAPGCNIGFINSISITGTSFTNLNSGCSGSSGNSYTSYLDTGNYTTSLFAGQSYSFSVTSSAAGAISVWIDYNQNGTFEASEWTQVSAASTANVASIVTVSIPSTASIGKTGIRFRFRGGGGANAATDACTTFGSGETEDYLIEIAQQSPCVAPPTAGTATTSATGICAGINYTLGLTGNSLGSGLTFQWQESLDSINWSDIIGANNSFYSTIALQNTYYRCYVTCSNVSDTSSVVLVAINPATLCYCVTALHNNTNCNPAGSINDVTITGTTLSNLATGCASTTGQSYSSYSPVGSNTASLDIGMPYSFNVTVGNANNTISLWIDYDQSGTFDANEWTQVSAATQANVPNSITVFIPITAISGQTGMRIRTRQQGGANAATDACTSFASGETEDYIITLVQPPPCVAPPTAGLSLATDSSVCAGVNFTLSLSGSSSGSGMSYTWQSSVDSLTWVAISGATSPFYTSALTQSAYYRCILTCSGLSDTSSVVYVMQNAATDCYCVSSANNASDTDIGNVNFGTLNNGVGTPATQNPTATGTYSDFTALQVQSYTQNITYPISITQINSANFFTANFAVYIDYNQNGDFTDVGETAFTGTTSNVTGGNTVSGFITIPSLAVPGHTRLRVVLVEAGGAGGTVAPCGNYPWGETEDYTIDIVQQVPCVAPPTAGLAAAADSSVCSVIGLTLVGATSGSGMTYEWQSSTDSISWTSISGANNYFYNGTQTSSSYYRCVLTCSGMSDTSSVVYILQNPAVSCYCTSNPTSNTNGDIGNVTFGALNNGVATPVTNNPTANGTYTDNTALAPVTFNQSTSYSISVAQIVSGNNFFGGRIAVYIDFNQNGLFTDAGEQVFTGTTTSAAANIASGNVIIPATSTLGNTRMRVVLTQGGAATVNPCGTYQFGETEDYTINIDLFNGVKNTNITPTSFVAYPNPSHGISNVSYTLTEKSNVNFELYNLVGKKVVSTPVESKNSGKYQTEFDFNQYGISAGVYFLKLNAGANSKTIRVVLE